MKSIVAFLGDIPIAELEFDQVRKWTTDLRKTRTSNTVRDYILKLRAVLKYLKARGYECLDAEAVGIPKRVMANFAIWSVRRLKMVLIVSR